MAIRHSQERILFYAVGSGNGLKGVVSGGPGHKKEVDPKKMLLFCDKKGHQTESRNCSGPDGIDNEDYSSCKREATDGCDEDGSI